MLNCIPRYDITKGQAEGSGFKEQTTDTSMHQCTIAKMHQRTNELFHSQILRIKYQDTFIWMLWLGAVKLAESIKNIKYLSKIIIFKNKNFELGHLCIGAFEHLDISVLTHSIIWRIILNDCRDWLERMDIDKQTEKEIMKISHGQIGEKTKRLTDI